MAKDAKTKQEIKAERKAQKAERKAQAEKAKKKASLTSKLIVISFIALIAVFGGLFAFSKVATSGIIERHTTVMSSENFSVTKSMMTYYFNSTYQNFAGQYGSSLSSFGLDTSKSLKSQKSIDGVSTWYDYFANQAAGQARQYLVLAEAAKAAGFELDEHDMEEINEVLDGYKEAAKEYNYDAATYVKLLFGNSVKLSDIKACIELAQLASKYAEHLGESYELTAEDYKAHYDANPDSYLKIDYLKHTFTAEKKDNKVDETSNADMKAKAEALKAKTTEADFIAYVKEILTAEAKAELKEGAELDTAAIDTKLEALKNEGALKSTLAGDDLKKWAFSAKALETYLVADEKAGTYTVYMIVKEQYRDEYITKNGAYLFLSDSTYGATGDKGAGSSAKADEIVNEWNAAGKNEAAFLELVEKYSEAGHAHLEKNLTKKVSYADGLYADDVTVGGVKKVYSETDKGTFLVYCAGDGFAAWEADADATLRNERYSDDYTKFETTYWVVVDEADMDAIIPVSLG